MVGLIRCRRKSITLSQSRRFDPYCRTIRTVPNVCMFCKENHGYFWAPGLPTTVQRVAKCDLCKKRVSAPRWQSRVETRWAATFPAPCGKNEGAVLGLEMETFVVTLNPSSSCCWSHMRCLGKLRAIKRENKLSLKLHSLYLQTKERVLSFLQP